MLDGVGVIEVVADVVGVVEDVGLGVGLSCNWNRNIGKVSFASLTQLSLSHCWTPP